MSVNILDAFLVSFGLETKDFEEGERKVREGSKRLREESKKTFDGMEREGKQVGAALKSVRNEVVGLGLAFMGARSITDLIVGMATGAATAERLGQTMGMTTRQVWSWRQAMRGVGGKDGDADAALQSIQRLRMSYQLGTLGADQSGALARLGISGGDLRSGNPGDILRKLSAAQDRMNPQLFASLMQQIGLNGPVTYFLMKGQDAVEKLLSKYEESADQQEELAKKTEDLQQQVADLNAKIQSALVPVLIRVADGLDKLVSLLPGGGSVGHNNSEGRKVVWEDKTFGGLFTLYADKPQGKGAGVDPFTMAENMVKGFTGMPVNLDPRKMGQGPAGSTAGNEATIYQFLRGKGLAHAQSLGIMAALHAESNLNERAVNPTSGAYGINQWLGSRKKTLMAKYGPNPTLKQQLDFLWWELNGGDHGGDDVLAEKSSRGAARAMISKFLRPAAGAETRGDWQRAQRYIARGGNGGIYINQMTVQTKDANSFSTDLKAKTRRHTVAKADQGVAP
ncbi:hypothetical protein GCM10011349_19850 [Novosphingobium indicum]|uniref:Phage tail lysozyme domain-containing protein n=1 Tax=Novosphingobium indicum TaxID=462949 RepID=A0ABQ2JK72_9SPHN|nr:phage tail tip lysozyme [Novosphingobium indicum]GGN49323.1 hypothetical protein GCM10011349_19850 [Novosphingobium indicum]